MASPTLPLPAQPEAPKTRLSFWQIWNMSFGFLGIQYAFGLQQANMSPIYRYLGADEADIPWLWLAGPVTGLLIQPVIGAASDRTWHKRWGRRRPYFMVGALLTSVALVLMPGSTSLWMAAGLLWLLDGSANVTMEPFRALIADKLPPSQRPLGYSMQSFFVGLGQTLANLMPLVLAGIGVATAASHTGAESSGPIPDFVRYAFFIGAAAILVTVGTTVLTTPELPPTPDELAHQSAHKANFWAELVAAFKDMPAAMRRLWWVKFFTWYALPLMWQYLSIAIAARCFNATSPTSPGFAEGVKYGNLGLAIFNVLCFAVSLLLPMLTGRFAPKRVHAACLAIGGAGFVAMNFTTSPQIYMVYMAMVGVAWASIMSTPYVMLSNAVPPARMGVYMGIFNMFIVVPQILNMVSIPFIYDSVLGGDPAHALALAGLSLGAAAVCSWRLKVG